MTYMPIPDPSMLTRRRALLLAGAGLGSVAFTACGGAGNAEGQPASPSETGSSTPQTSSPEASASGSGDASATPTPVGETFSKGFSGGSQAPEGEYRPADDKGPAQNVPKPQEPEGMNLETPEAFFKFIEYWNEQRNYALQTGDVKGYAHITSGAYTKELQAISYMKSVYEKGGWIIGGIRKIFYEKDSFEKVSGKDYEYSLLGRTAIPPTLIFDNERRTIRTEDFTEQNKYSVEFKIVYTGTDWLMREVQSIVKFDK